MNSMEHVEKPWGEFDTILHTEAHKVKNIRVFPGKRLSLQSHQHRSEHWIIVGGEAKVQIGDSFQTLGPNQYCYIPKNTQHRIENTGNDVLEFVEVQYGEYLDDADITRYEDDYGRVSLTE